MRGLRQLQPHGDEAGFQRIGRRMMGQVADLRIELGCERNMDETPSSARWRDLGDCDDTERQRITRGNR